MSKFTMEEGINAAGFGRAQLWMALITGFFQASDAMELMMISFIGPTLQCAWGLSTAQASSLATVVFLGMLFGTYFWGIMADKYGRKTVLLYDCLFVFSFAMISAFSVNFGMLAFCRTMVGFGLGGFGVVWSYFLEFVPTADRGRWACILLSWWSVGTVLEAGLAWAVLPTLGWRWLLVLSALPLVPVFFGLFTIPESPRYLLVNDRVEEATKILERIALSNKHSLPEGSLKLPEQEEVPGPLEVFKLIFNRSWRVLTSSLWVLWFTNAFVYYGLVLMTTVLRYSGESENICEGDEVFSDQDYIDVFVATAAEIPGLIISLAIVDRLGRKYSQVILFAGCAFFIILLIPLEGETSASVSILFLARVCITGAFTVTYLYTPEVYPTNIRTTAFGYANSFARFGGMTSPFVSQDLIHAGHAWAAELIFAAFSILATLAAWMLPVETAGRAMQDQASGTSLECKNASIEVEMIDTKSDNFRPGNEEIGTELEANASGVETTN